MPFYTVELKVSVIVHDDTPERAKLQACTHTYEILRNSLSQYTLRVINADNVTELKKE